MLIYIDLKTTGYETNDKICAVAVLLIDNEKKEIIKEFIDPQKKVRPEASAVHHITNEMVKDTKSFEESSIKELLEKYNAPEHTLIGHNTPFIFQNLAKEGFIYQGSFIDTLKSTRVLIPECEQFALQFLRYELGLYRVENDLFKELNMDSQRTEIGNDALHVRLLHLYLNDLADDERLQELSSAPALLQKFGFGKYKGRYIEEIAMNDRGYLTWMFESMENLDEDMRYSIEHYLKMV